MANIIITAVDPVYDRTYDLEVPDDLEVDKLTDDILQTLMGAVPERSWVLDGTVLHSTRLQRDVRSECTLSEEGVLNGDYLLIYERSEERHRNDNIY